MHGNIDTVLIVMFCLLTLSCTAVSNGREQAAADPAPAGQAVEGNNRFALDLYGELIKENREENIFFSPVSISTALAMTYAGAKGDTAKEMAQTFHFDLVKKRLHSAYKKLLSALNDPQAGKSRAYELAVANALWGQKGYKWLDSFLDVTEKNYGAGLKEIDFARAAEKARVTINRWVEKQTNSKIRDLIPEGVLGPMTRLVLTNAVYFKGTWTHTFKKRSTRDGDFTCAPGKSKTVPLMRQTEHFKYAESEGVKVLEMTYKGNDLSMVVILPGKNGGFAPFEKALTLKKLSGLISKLKHERVDVKFPRFKMTSSFQMQDVLSSMGMKKAFIFGKADFSGMNGVTSGNDRLFISAVIHKAFVDVNETGTEAAAATGAVMRVGMAPQRPKTFHADRPFVFLIRDMRSDNILFMGRVLKPE